MLRIISLGAGVQSTTMALMAARGEIAPMPDCAIFADTQSEPQAVYEHLQWLMSPNVLPFPVHIVTAGSLRDQIMGGAVGRNRTDGRPPFYTLSGGMLNRQCTQDFKIRPIERKVRELLGLKPRRRWPNKPLVEQWIGISTDESIRMKLSRRVSITNRWPLIEKGMARHACISWLDRNGYPRAPKSACTFCPYHSDLQWRDLRDNAPEDFADAIAVDQAIRTMPGQREPWFLYPDRVPLSAVDLSTAEDRGQLNLFNNECEGMCGN